MGRGVLPSSRRVERMVPLGPRTCRLCLAGGRVVIAKWGSAWEGAVLRVIEDLGIAPRLLAPPQRPHGPRGGGRLSQAWLLLMTESEGAPPAWTDQTAMAGVMGALGDLHRRTARSDGTVLCHGDFHRTNLLWDGQRATLLDWANAHRGAPLDDLARIVAPSAEEKPGCDLPTGACAELALALYHRQGPLAHLSWTAFLAEHRAATERLLRSELERHQMAVSGAPDGLRPWIELQLQQVQRQIDHLNV